MKKVKISIPAKVNLTLDILGVCDGYHNIESLVTSVNIYDKVILTKRTDKQVTLKELGIKPKIEKEKNNAYIAAKKFIETFNTLGVDIELKKNISVGAGLGGSSADIAAIILGMVKLYGVKRDVSKFAAALGSDVNYMMCGGYAVMRNKGEIIEKIRSKERLYLLLVIAEKEILTKECYEEYDRQAKTYPQATKMATTLLACKDKENLIKTFKNDLYYAAKKLYPKIETNAKTLEKYAKTVLTGSGSCVCGVFKSKQERNKVYKKLYPIFKEKIIKAKTCKK